MSTTSGGTKDGVLFLLPQLITSYCKGHMPPLASIDTVSIPNGIQQRSFRAASTTAGKDTHTVSYVYAVRLTVTGYNSHVNI